MLFQQAFQQRRSAERATKNLKDGDLAGRPSVLAQEMLYLRQQSLNDQQVHLMKKNLRLVVVFLCASANFGK